MRRREENAATGRTPRNAAWAASRPTFDSWRLYFLSDFQLADERIWKNTLHYGKQLVLYPKRLDQECKILAREPRIGYLKNALLDRQDAQRRQPKPSSEKKLLSQLIDIQKTKAQET
jgi:hypothetical protein